MKIVIAGAVCILLAGCDVNTSGRIDFDASDLRYQRDERTGLCFAATASRKTMSTETTGLGLTHVPCTDEVLRLAGE